MKVNYITKSVSFNMGYCFFYESYKNINACYFLYNKETIFHKLFDFLEFKKTGNSGPHVIISRKYLFK